jgi:zinc and cadmium transporter
VAGFLAFFVLEQFLHWHHCHRTDHSGHRPLGNLILLADGLHNLIGGLAVGGAFVVDLQVGIVTWLVAAAHEVPQELGDFGVLVHAGWPKRPALAWNVVSALTFLVGGVVAYMIVGAVDVGYPVPFAAGNFVYIAAADLLPELATQTRVRDKLETTAALTIGLAVLLGATWLG